MQKTKHLIRSRKFFNVLTGLLAIVAMVASSMLPRAGPVSAAIGTNEQINYQARLLDATGAVVPDGFYNIEFKIYQDGDGVLGGGDETLKWTETRESGNKVQIKNGYLSVYLGSVNPFVNSVDWNQSLLWLSINIGGTAAPAYDGQMSPFTRFSSTPYALNSKYLGGLSSSQFVQLAQGAQTDSSTTNPSIYINKTGATANILQLQRATADVLLINNAGQTTFKPTTDSQAAFQIQPSGSTTPAFNVDTSNSRISIGTATPLYKIDVRSAGSASQLHLSATDVDSGGYLTSASATNFYFSGGSAWNGANWVAKATTSGIIGTLTGDVQVYTNTGLTAGNTFTPAQRLIILATGNVGVGSDTTPDALFSVGPNSELQVNASGQLIAGSITTTFGAIDTGVDNITTTGTIGTASTTTFTGNTGTFSGAIAANGGITFDQSTDTLGAHTLAGTLDAANNILTNIGNAGTDFIASTGALNLAGALGANGGITFDNATDTLGAFTLAGTLDAANNILTNIGNAGTDFIASTGALNLAGILTANGGISVGANQDITTVAGTGTLTLNNTVTNASDNAFVITPSFTGGATDALTYNAMLISAFSPTNGAGADNINGINIGNLTDPGATIVSAALRFGSGWDSVINDNGVLISATELDRLDGKDAALVDQNDFISGDGAGATSNGSGLEAGTGGIGLLQGCANNQILKWVDGTSVWNCAADATGVSDARLKKNIETVQGEFLSRIREVRVVDFDFDCSHEAFQKMHCDIDHQTGVIAQELMKIFPELVIDVDGHYEVRYGALNLYTLKAAAELGNLVAEQDNNISTFNAAYNDQFKTLSARVDLSEEALRKIDGLEEQLRSSLFSGSVEISGTANFADKASFQELVTFASEVNFEQNVLFKGHPIFSQDTGGFATILKGDKEVKIEFSAPYGSIPVVSVNNADGQFAEYTYTDLTEEGFTIILKHGAPKDIKFSWTAFEIDKALTQLSHQPLIGAGDP